MRLPAEWEPQAGVMLTWPHADTDWADRLARVEATFTAIGSAVSRRETLLVVARSRDHLAHIQGLLLEAGVDPGQVRYAIASSNDSWARDHGPLCTLADDGRVLVNDFVFNAWGGKFDARRDDAITAGLDAQRVFANAERRRHRLVLEGGAVETDGRGTLLATGRSLIDARRNPGLDRAALEQALAGTLGIERFLWLEHGTLSGDDTDSHIDILARFAAPDTILYTTAGPGSPDHLELASMRAELAALRTREGRPYHLVALPDAGHIAAADGRRLAASFANFLVINGAVLVPVYAVAADEIAQRIVQECFPGRDIIPIDCRPLIEQNGSLHCLTMQFPAALEIGGPCLNET